MPKIRNINQLFMALDEYVSEVNQSPLAVSSKLDYIYFAECFVRWLDSDFTPGAFVGRVGRTQRRTEFDDE